MKNTNTTAVAQNVEVLPKEEETTQIVKRQSNEMAAQELGLSQFGFDKVKAELDAELEKNLRQLSVTEFISPTKLLSSSDDNAISPYFDLLDCFDFEITEDAEIKEIVMYVCDFGDNGGVKFVAQSMTLQREKWLKTFGSARVAKTQLTLTNVRFRRLDKGGRAGNRPIIIELVHGQSNILKRPLV